VTFLFTDIEGSMRLWEQHPESMAVALERRPVPKEEIKNGRNTEADA